MSQITKRAILQSFMKLLNDRPLDKITIRDIVDDCGVTRSTFYYYFEDIYDLLAAAFQTETERVLSGHKTYLSWQEGMLDATAFALENRRAIYHVYNSLSREHLERYLNSVIGQLMLEVVRSTVRDLPIQEADIQMVAELYQFALVGMITHWLQGGMKLDPEAWLARMGSLLEGNIRYTLAKTLDTPPPA